jgi:hypothetical protein
MAVGAVCLYRPRAQISVLLRVLVFQVFAVQELDYARYPGMRVSIIQFIRYATSELRLSLIVGVLNDEVNNYVEWGFSELECGFCLLREG